MNTILLFPNCLKRRVTLSISVGICFLLFSSCSKDIASEISNQSVAKAGDEIGTAAAMYVTPETEDIVMYEININAFSSMRNLRGIINRLDAIKALGVNTIWLMPIYPVGTVNSFGSPYCVKNYTAVNPSFGTITILQELVDKAHQRNLSVILDWVGNHTSWDNVWMSHPDWYTHNTSGQIISPAGTNWADVADLNYNNTEMRTAMIAAMRYWVNVAGVDGFRCDAADYVPFDFWQQAITSLQTGRRKQLIMLAEGARNDHFAAGFKMNWSWNYVTAIKNVFGPANFSPTSIYTVNTSEYAAVPIGSKKLRFTTNHDESNTALPVTVFNNKNGALCASAITIFLQGVPLLYSGQEVGVASTSVYNGGTINWSANADMLTGYQQLLAFYNSSPAARKGELITYSDANIVAFTKTLGNEQILVLANPRGSLSGFAVPAVLAGTYLNVLTNTTVTISNNLGFSAYKYLILKKIN
ncbi:MAG: alpha-amylase [Flavobacterium sp.]|nr:alpha-amylase [Flavobacterium sp.]